MLSGARTAAEARHERIDAPQGAVEAIDRGARAAHGGGDRRGQAHRAGRYWACVTAQRHARTGCMFTLIALALAASLAGGAPAAEGPPPATVTAAGETRTMAIGSYCWTTADSAICVDRAAPARGPRMALDPGRRVTFRFGFDPAEVTLDTGPRLVALPARRTVRWRVRGEVRRLSLFVRPEGGGDVSYAARASRG